VCIESLRVSAYKIPTETPEADGTYEWDSTTTQKALFHGHCLHKAIMKIDHDRQLLEKLGLHLEVLDSGCCGMAGAFGFEKDRYDVSIACGERVLLPKVRSAAKDALIITDGFSCREQIRQTTDRGALHIAQVVQIAMNREGGGSPENLWKRELVIA
jgi:Fe-S oxidoreductase